MQDSNCYKGTFRFLDKTLYSTISVRDHFDIWRILPIIERFIIIIIISYNNNNTNINYNKRRPDDRNHSPLATFFPYLSFILTYILTFSTQAHAVHEHLCLEDDYTNDLPIFIEKRTICNYDTVPVLVYPIKITPDTDYETKLCLKGEFAETFDITKEKELKLFGRLEQIETNLKLQIIRTANDIIGTPGERRQAINAIQFILNLEDCNQVSWQTIVVAILSSVCVFLTSTLAIMLILYQQKGLIRTRNDDERAEDLPYTGTQFSDESFINPRRTSSYEFSTLSKHTEISYEDRETKDF